MSARQFAAAKISGGPLGKNTKLEIDGEEVTGVTSLNLDISMDNLVRLTVDRIVEVHAELDGGIVEDVWKVRVNRRNVTFVEGQGGTHTWEVLAEVKADTIWEGLADCAKQLELAAKTPNKETR